MELRVRLDHPNKHGIVERDHLVQVGAPVPEIDVPDVLSHVWAWFWELNASRGGGMGPGPISFSEIDAWRRLTGADPTREEIAALREMDSTYLAAVAKRTA